MGLDHFFHTWENKVCEMLGVMAIMDVSQLTFIVFKQNCLALLGEYVTLFVPSSTVFFGLGIETGQVTMTICVFALRRFHPTN